MERENELKDIIYRVCGIYLQASKGGRSVLYLVFRKLNDFNIALEIFNSEIDLVRKNLFVDIKADTESSVGKIWIRIGDATFESDYIGMNLSDLLYIDIHQSPLISVARYLPKAEIVRADKKELNPINATFHVSLTP